MLDLCTISRWLGYALTGERVMLCTVAYREDWRIVPLIDAAFWLRERMSYHCARSAAWDHDNPAN